MLNTFFSWEGWNAINSITQLLLAFAAFFTIIYALNKDKSYLKPKLSLDYKIGMNLWKSNETNEISIVVGVGISILNMGVSPIYITDCGIQFGKGKDKPGFMCMINEPLLLNSGERKTSSITHLDLLFPEVEKEGKIKSTDKVIIYVKTGTGAEIFKDTKLDYDSFKKEYEQKCEQASKQKKTCMTNN